MMRRNSGSSAPGPVTRTSTLSTMTAGPGSMSMTARQLPFWRGVISDLTVGS